MTHPRLPKDELYLRIAELMSHQATCPRRQVGCVLVDRRNRILATGYNGVPSGAPHCTDVACPGAGFPSGQGLEHCEAIHAEQNAILLLPDPWEVATAYVTTFPCDSCIKLFLGTSCRRIVYRDSYPHPSARDRWAMSGGEAVQMTLEV